MSSFFDRPKLGQKVHSPNIAEVAENVVLGSLKAARDPTMLEYVDALLNISDKSVPQSTRRPTMPYAQVPIPDSADPDVMLPKLIYCVRWVIEQTVAGATRIAVTSHHGTNRGPMVVAMYLISWHKYHPLDAIAAIDKSMELRNKWKMKPKVRALSNPCLRPILLSMVHNNDFGIGIDAPASSSSELLLDPPFIPMRAAARRPLKQTEAAFIDYMMGQRNYGSYLVRRRHFIHPLVANNFTPWRATFGPDVTTEAVPDAGEEETKAEPGAGAPPSTGGRAPSRAGRPATPAPPTPSAASVKPRFRPVGDEGGPYPPVEVVQWWVPPTWETALPPFGRVRVVPNEFVDLTSPSTWAVKANTSMPGGVIKLDLGNGSELPVLRIADLAEGQSLLEARVVCLKWVQEQPAGDGLDKVPVHEAMGEMRGKNYALLDPKSPLVTIRAALNTLVELLGYTLNARHLVTPKLELMRKEGVDLKALKQAAKIAAAKRAGAL